MSLTNVIIGNNVNYIGNSAFSDCVSLKSVVYKGTSDPGSKSSNVFYNCPCLKEANVPNNYKDKEFCGIPVNNGKTPEADEQNQTSATITIVFSVIGCLIVVIVLIIVIACYFKKRTPEVQTNELTMSFIS